MVSKRISIIIPTYNRARTIKRALESVFNQTRVPDEIIVIDDGSEDKTQDILADYKGRITLISDGNNYGVSVARNRGLDVASGHYVAFLDSDDTLPPDSIDNRAKMLEKHDAVDVVYGDAHLIDTKGKILNRFSQLRPYVRPSGDAYFHFLQHNLAPIHTFMVRRTSFTESLRMNTTLKTLEDYDYWLRLSEYCSFLYLDQVVANYHIHDLMTTHLENEIMRTNRVIVQKDSLTRPRFQDLSPHQKVQIYTQIGAEVAVVQTNLPEARSFLMQALRITPFHWSACLYWLLTWSGKRGVSSMNSIRRRFMKYRRRRFPNEKRSS